MKSSLLMALGMFVAFNANAFRDASQDVNTDLFEGEIYVSAELKQFHPDMDLSYANKIGGGHVSLDLVKNEATLYLGLRGPVCPTGRLCPLGMPSPVIRTLPIKSIEKGSCGEVVVRAEKDLRPVDGNFEQLVIADHSKSTCRCMPGTRCYVPGKTSVQHNVITSGMDGNVATYKSVYYGDKLKGVEFHTQN